MVNINTRYFNLLILVLLILPTASCSEHPETIPFHERCHPDTEPGDEGHRILFIGNSLTYWFDVGGILADLFEEADVPFEIIDTIAEPNYGLQDHWANAYVHNRIAEGWDVVVMQQGPSATEGRPSLLEYSKLFSEEIRAAGGEPALYMVWPSRARFFDFDGVSDSYAAAADSVDGLLFPAGEAWRAAWAQDPDLNLYGDDGFHPSPLGSYLAALVMFEQLSGLSAEVLGESFCPPGYPAVEMSSTTASLLQDAATEANEAFGR